MQPERAPRTSSRGRYADDEPDAGVRDQIDRAAQPEVPPRSREALEAEFEAEEEEEKDEAELRHELGHLRGADQRELRRLVRPEQEPGEEVRRDRREPEAAGHEPERAEAQP